MKNKFTLVTLAVALGLGSYMYFVEAKQKAPTDSTDVAVWSLDDNQAKAAGLDTLEVKSGAKDAVYKLDGDAWHLANQPKRDLRSSDWDTAYNNIKSLMASRKLDAHVKDLGTYGLAKPAIALHWGPASAGYGLEIGDKNPTGDAYFVHCDKDDTIYTVASWKVDSWKQLAENPPLAPLPTPSPSPSPSPKASSSPAAPMTKNAAPAKPAAKK